MWNIAGVGRNARELREVLAKNKTFVVVLSELKSTSMEGLREPWPGAQGEVVPSKRQRVRSAPKEGLAILLRRGITYCVRQVIGEGEEVTNVVVQTVKVDIVGEKRIIGACILTTV